MSTLVRDRERLTHAIRERLAETSSDEVTLRVMLTLAHEALGAPPATAPSRPQAAPVAIPAELAPTDYGRLRDRIHALARAHVPAGCSVLVVSRGDEGLLVPGYQCSHFPQLESGDYAGYYPIDGASAVAHLEECRSRGGEFLVLPRVGFWWLSFYGELSSHLLTSARIAHHDENCLIADLRPHSGVKEDV